MMAQSNFIISIIYCIVNKLCSSLSRTPITAHFLSNFYSLQYIYIYRFKRNLPFFKKLNNLFWKRLSKIILNIQSLIFKITIRSFYPV